jgi:hypothetical protein
MRTIVSLLVAAASTLLLPGTAVADSDTYRVRDSWKLTYVNGDPRIVPHAEDNVVELTCHNEDRMTDWWVNDKDLVDRSWERADGTGVQVRPEFTGETATLKITIVCEKA